MKIMLGIIAVPFAILIVGFLAFAVYMSVELVRSRYYENHCTRLYENPNTGSRLYRCGDGREYWH